MKFREYNESRLASVAKNDIHVFLKHQPNLNPKGILLADSYLSQGDTHEDAANKAAKKPGTLKQEKTPKPYRRHSGFLT